MVDSFGRNIDYIRMSLTSRCQQKCIYCARENGGRCVKENELSASDFIFAAEAFAELGFKKIRLTGGEPLLRKDILEIIRGVSSIGSYEDIALTTNGLELDKFCLPLKEAGLKRINVSLDSLKADTYESITGASLDSVVKGINKAVKVFDEVKINAVLIKGVNDNPDELVEFAKYNPVTVRFIELMPMGGRGEGIKGEDILARYPFLVPVKKADGHSPEILYTSYGFSGKIGLINSISDSFCKNCNRMRLTWDGKLRPCLGVDMEIDAAESIVAKDKAALCKLITEAINIKPEKNKFSDNFSSCRPMTGIGG